MVKFFERPTFFYGGGGLKRFVEGKGGNIQSNLNLFNLIEFNLLQFD